MSANPSDERFYEEELQGWLRHLLDAPFCFDCPDILNASDGACEADEVCHQRAAFSPERPLMVAVARPQGGAAGRGCGMSEWRNANAITNWEFAKIGELLCDNEPRDLALKIIRLEGQIEVCKMLRATSIPAHPQSRDGDAG
jgi:hypothetical protein